METSISCAISLGKAQYFDSIKIRTRQKIERVNCRVGCIDLDDNANPNKYDIPLTYSQPKSMVVYPVPMPTRGRTLESTFLYTFDRVDIYNKKCRNCNDGIKKQTTKLELTSMPHSIIIGLNRGIPNANGVTIDKDETKVNLEKEFYLELPNGDRKKFTLVATSQHTGKFRICPKQEHTRKLRAKRATFVCARSVLKKTNYVEISSRLGVSKVCVRQMEVFCPKMGSLKICILEM